MDWFLYDRSSAMKELRTRFKVSSMLITKRELRFYKEQLRPQRIFLPIALGTRFSREETTPPCRKKSLEGDNENLSVEN